MFIKTGPRLKNFKLEPEQNAKFKLPKIIIFHKYIQASHNFLKRVKSGMILNICIKNLA